MALSDKSSAGVVNQFYYDPQLTDGALYVWQTCGDVQDTIEMTILKPFMGFTTGTDDGEFPVEWLDAVTANLALRLGVKLKTPADKDLRDWAKYSKFMAMTADAEGVSTYFQPKYRG